jgi:hypothetical protein
LKKSIDFSFDDHPADDDERARVAWAVAVVDDCEGCDDLRIEVTLEDEGASGTGVTAHLAAATARRLRAAVAAALREVGEDPGP